MTPAITSQLRKNKKIGILYVVKCMRTAFNDLLKLYNTMLVVGEIIYTKTISYNLLGTAQLNTFIFLSKII